MIDSFKKQLTFEPVVRRPLATVAERIVIGGMGGSALAGEAFAYLLPESEILVHRDYGLPKFSGSEAVYIAISYSGTTEETLNFANEALSRGYPLAVVCAGGTLAEFAEREGLPLVLVPSGLQPRNASIYMVRALLALTQRKEELDALAHISLAGTDIEEMVARDTEFVLEKLPVFYSSNRNMLLARAGRIMMNETARLPAILNQFPELNHNEMQSFDAGLPENLEHLFAFFVIRDERDHPRITRRMEVFRLLMEERGRSVRIFDISTMSPEEALATTLLRFTLAARGVATSRGNDPDTVPLIETFKKML